MRTRAGPPTLAAKGRKGGGHPQVCGHKGAKPQRHGTSQRGASLASSLAPLARACGPAAAALQHKQHSHVATVLTVLQRAAAPPGNYATPLASNVYTRRLYRGVLRLSALLRLSQIVSLCVENVR
jgi:hypothetical protein